MKLKTLLGAVALGLAPVLVHAQEDYPSRAITLIVPYAPGGVTDTSGRAVADALSRSLGVTVVVENIGGAGGAIGTAQASQAEADGYTLLYATLGVLAISPHLTEVQYDPLEDFEAVAAAISSPSALVVPNDFPPNSVQELIEYAEAHPGEVLFGSSGVGGITHIIGELFKEAAGIDIVHVPYSGGGAAMTDLLAGRVQILFDSQPTERVNSGQVKGLAAMSPTRLNGLPDMPTIAEAGLPEYEAGNSWLGLMAPAGTPDAVVAKLSDAMMQVAEDPAFVEAMQSLGANVTPMPSEEFAEQIRTDHAFYGAAIERLGIAAE